MLSHYCSVCFFCLVIRGKKKKKEEKIKEGWIWNQGFLLCGSGLNSIFSFIAGQQTACSSFVQPEVLRVSMLHGYKVSLKCPKCVRISIFFPSCSRKNFGVPAAYHSHKVTVISWFIEECSFWFYGAGTALMQMFHKGFRDPLFSSVCVFWLSNGWA